MVNVKLKHASLATRSGSSPSLETDFAREGARKRVLSGLKRVSLEERVEARSSPAVSAAYVKHR